jgi:hypothetical protein
VDNQRAFNRINLVQPNFSTLCNQTFQLGAVKLCPLGSKLPFLSIIKNESAKTAVHLPQFNIITHLCIFTERGAGLGGGGDGGQRAAPWLGVTDSAGPMLCEGFQSRLCGAATAGKPAREREMLHNLVEASTGLFRYP